MTTIAELAAMFLAQPNPTDGILHRRTHPGMHHNHTCYPTLDPPHTWVAGPTSSPFKVICTGATTGSVRPPARMIDRSSCRQDIGEPEQQWGAQPVIQFADACARHDTA
jgi:hypothetical protein